MNTSGQEAWIEELQKACEKDADEIYKAQGENSSLTSAVASLHEQKNDALSKSTSLC